MFYRENKDVTMTQTILIAESKPLVRMMIKNGLKGYGFDFVEAEDGESAVQAFEEHRNNVALVIGDVQLSGKTGIQAMREIKQSRPSVPYVILTSVTHKAVVIECLRAGVNAFLAKPLHMVQLKTKVFDLLGIRHEMTKDGSTRIVKSGSRSASPRLGSANISDLQSLVKELAQAS